MASLVLATLPCRSLAYVGPGAGLELAPYSWGLLAWVGLALLAVLLWPLSVLYQRVRKRSTVRTPSASQERAASATPPPVATGNSDNERAAESDKS